MDTGNLFYDDEHAALRITIETGKGYKATAALLYPAMKPESAYAKLKHATSGTNGESLKFGEVVAICRFNESYDALYWFCDEVQHTRPARVTPSEEESKIAAVIESATETMNKALAALERINSLRAVRRVS